MTPPPMFPEGDYHFRGIHCDQFCGCFYARRRLRRADPLHGAGRGLRPGCFRGLLFVPGDLLLRLLRRL